MGQSCFHKKRKIFVEKLNFFKKGLQKNGNTGIMQHEIVLELWDGSEGEAACRTGAQEAEDAVPSGR